MGSRLGARRALVSLVVFGALAGCGDDSAVEVTATPVPTVSSATPEPSPTPTAPATAVPLPVMPPEMANNDAAGAEAAVRYFIDLYSYTYLSRDTAPFKAMSAEDCVFCNSVLAEVDQMIAAGETQSGGGVTVDAISSNAYHADVNAHILELETTQAPYIEAGWDEEVLAENDGATLAVSIILQKSLDGWIVLEAGANG